ncbi:uncharacterized protein LOC126894306 [Daktulosphaira vitifoliae]|uniref:uncharacterized protein LOC126894306 n=1 Tax=Daktulosphaira vitifoliae TaxID=58002 RepID=UPI0021AA833A|nr:uncharacterized protein LOC126894306 [Daktulosphaira vitifoliae]
MNFHILYIVLFSNLVYSKAKSSLSSSQYTPIFRPNLPAGPFKIKVTAYMPCDFNYDHLINFNHYLSKTSPTRYEIMGNLTFLIPFDDSLTMNLNYAVKGSNGGWIKNSHLIVIKNACSSLKSHLGNRWLNYTTAFHFKETDCPISPGDYVSSGIDQSIFEYSDVQKYFFYGEYKVTQTFINSSGDIVGCSESLQNIVRPWE